MRFLSRMRQTNALWLFSSAFFLLAGLILRATLRSSSTLWEDEIIAATHAVQPLGRLFLNVIINDIHPPLYFLELHFWSYFSQADWWLIANSVLFSLLAIILLFTVIRRLLGDIYALTVSAVFAVLPVCLWMAEEVRMYAMLSVIFIGMYYFTYRSFASVEEKRRPYLMTALFAVATVYTHAIGFVAVLFYGLYAASYLITRKVSRREWLLWLAVFGGVGVLSLPMLVADILHQADMPPLQGFHDVLDWMASVVTGDGYRLVGWLNIVGLLTFLAAAVIGIYIPRTRRLALFFLIGPLALCIVIGIVGRPIFKTDFFSDFSSPFLAIVIGSLLAELPVKHGVRALVLSLTLAGLLSMAVANRLALNATEIYYRDTINAIKAKAQPGDVLWVPQTDIFWGVCWYMIGPHWGSPLSIAAPLRPGSRWYTLFDRFDPDLVAKLDLLPKSQSVTTSGGVKIMTASTSETEAQQTARLWLVTYAPRNDIPAELLRDHVGPLHHHQSLSFPPLQVNLYERR